MLTYCLFDQTGLKNELLAGICDAAFLSFFLLKLFYFPTDCKNNAKVETCWNKCQHVIIKHLVVGKTNKKLK